MNRTIDHLQPPAFEGHAELLRAASAGGLDLRSAVQRLGGDGAIYLELLRSFSADLATVPGRLAELLERGERDDAARLMHTVKGVAATLGARTLAAAAADAETRFARPDGARFDGRVSAEFKAAASTALTVLPGLADQLQDCLPRRPVAATLSPADLRRGLAELASLLAESDMRAVDLCAQLRRSAPAPLRAALSALDEAVSALDFARAEQQCRVVLATLKTMEGDLVDHGGPDFAVTSLAIPQLSGRVLLAEDGLDNQRLLGAFLRQAGVSVTVVGNGRDAVEIALRQDFDLILMDIQMPLMDGVDATRMLRAAGYQRPIIALTANVMKADTERYRQAGCNDVLAKPVDRDAFYELVSQQLAAGDAAAGEPDDPGYRHEMAELKAAFVAGLPAQIDSIRTALRSQDTQGLTSLMHTLKGTAGAYGFGRLTDLAGAVEGELRAERLSRAAALCEGLLLETIAAHRAAQ